MDSQMTDRVVHGVYAALLTPRLKDDNVDASALTALVKFLMGKGISSFAVNGATGEYCLTTPDQLRTVLSTIREASNDQATVLCGVGAAGSALSIVLAGIAQAANVKGLLLPMPYFFPYGQQDLESFCREIAGSTSLPVLLYNLPQFTSGLSEELVHKLILEVPNIVGIKDSGGSLDILGHLTRSGVKASRIVGNDNVLAAALVEGVCDGVVSGVACVLPELVSAQYHLSPTADKASFEKISSMMGEVIAQLNRLPTPWGLKWFAEARGVMQASFSQPQSSERLATGYEMSAWLKQRLPAMLSEIERAVSGA
jgi:Dihydrodipicolinate synthase/N-acetylneuraminate lyase